MFKFVERGKKQKGIMYTLIYIYITTYDSIYIGISWEKLSSKIKVLRDWDKDLNKKYEKRIDVSRKQLVKAEIKKGESQKRLATGHYLQRVRDQRSDVGYVFFY
jgi:hypothetical protein